MNRVEHDADGGVKEKAQTRMPHAAIDHFMGETYASQLLAEACAREADFARTEVTSDEEPRALDLDARRSWTLRGGSALLNRFEAQVRSQADGLLAAVGMAPIADLVLECGLFAHRHGDYFRRHIDLFAAERRRHATHDRIATLVYHLHIQPKRFGGGELVLYSLAGAAGALRLPPEHDRLVVFPAYLPHEVEPVSVPGDAFAHARFSINCWLGRPRG
ncbi:2OG-Fe(II) oxygenase [Erythrobacter mangrovi]|uniref:2OG-Fe(II) oxygenase n=1 Tax=Erythrobacter mangrovi TaxID=2739433 RepID=A0A7D3X8N3_9SPHN|nr:2OG-Fe(II) oxygenase [Erythrobacter mangrovi]QKG70295.1 2OG-Fe(II) oxygenase [Erythrobacter mangrovi]